MSDLRTFDDWSKEGYRIKKGARHVARRNDNVPLFDESQVYKPEPRGSYGNHWRGCVGTWNHWGDNDWDYEDPLNYDNWMGN